MMYINNISIVYYLVIGLVGLFVGKLTAWANTIYIDEGTPKLGDFLKRRKETFEMQYVIMIVIAGCYIGLLYQQGAPNTFLKALDLLKFLILTPMLVSSFLIDLKHRIIPNRLNMLMFEIGILLTFVYGISNISIAQNMLLGCLAGGGIFLAITLLGGLIAGKEAMGLGDVKFMGAVRTIFWNDSNLRSSAFKFFHSSRYFYLSFNL
ncbi:MAG: prepilin peptidase [Clostridia bacterium]|nr:prepilin peptidase [Clostridia bacterium]